MPTVRCDCGKTIELKEGENQMEYFGDGDDDTELYGRCRFCGKIFK